MFPQYWGEMDQKHYLESEKINIIIQPIVQEQLAYCKHLLDVNTIMHIKNLM